MKNKNSEKLKENTDKDQEKNMFPLLLSPLLTAVTSVASGAGSLALGAVKTAAKALVSSKLLNLSLLRI